MYKSPVITAGLNSICYHIYHVIINLPVMKFRLSTTRLSDMFDLNTNNSTTHHYMLQLCDLKRTCSLNVPFVVSSNISGRISGNYFPCFSLLKKLPAQPATKNFHCTTKFIRFFLFGFRISLNKSPSCCQRWYDGHLCIN